MNVHAIQAAVTRGGAVEQKITAALLDGTYTVEWAHAQLAAFTRSIEALPPAERYYAARSLNHWAAKLPSDDPADISAWLELHEEIRAMWDETRREDTHDGDTPAQQ